MAIHQPQYLPWLGYFDKADQADVFVYLDTVTYQKNGLQNRNRIKSAAGPLWLTVPVTASLGTAIRDVRISGSDWRRKHIETIAQSYSRAAYLERFRVGLKPLLEQDWVLLSDLAIAATEWLMNELGIRAHRIRASELAATGDGQDLILSICRELGAAEYLSGTGARSYQDQSRFDQAGISLRYQSYSPVVYTQCHRRTQFIEGLSAVDLVLNCGPDASATMRAGRKA